jgi:hypothetical protein
MMTSANTTTVTHPARPVRRRRLLRWIGGTVGAIVLLWLAWIGFAMWRMNYVPADLDLSTTRLSEQGLYQSSYVPDAEAIPINRIHSWVLHVETPDGQPIENAQIRVDGDMPQHGHGLPTRPQVTRELGGGDYLVEGMKFQMGGWWVMDFYITSGDESDVVHFNLVLK